MNKSNVTIPGIKGTSKLVRPRFGPGMLLQHEDLELLNSYTRDLSRLLFGSLLGCGVICGLVVKVGDKCGKSQVTVTAGVALACSGDPIHIPTDQSFALSEDCPPEIDSPLWVVLCATSKCCAPRPSLCESDDDETSECTREREGFEIRVLPERPTCVCGCPEPAPATGTPDTSTPAPNPNPPAGQAVPALNVTGAQQPGRMDCQCADPNSDCYKDHYLGNCGCNCDDCNDCDCKCILLARLDREGDTDNWFTDHSVRRFIRPVLMRDPQIAADLLQKQQAETEGLDAAFDIDTSGTTKMAAKKTTKKASKLSAAAQKAAQKAAAEKAAAEKAAAERIAADKIAAEEALKAAEKAAAEKAAAEKAAVDKGNG